MSEPALDRLSSLEDEEEAKKEIELIIGKGRDQLKQDAKTFEPKKSGIFLPILLNISLLLIAALVLFGAWLLFQAAQEGYTLQSTAREFQGTDIISALLAEAESALEQKIREIQAIESELQEIERQLEALGMTDLVERQRLLDRRVELEQRLDQATAERSTLENQISVQTRNLEQARTGAPVSAQSNELQALQEQQQFRIIYDSRIDQGFRNLSAIIGTAQWELALTIIEDIKAFISTFTSEPSGVFLQNRGALDLQSLETIEIAVLAAQDNWEPIEEIEEEALSGDPEEAARLLARINQQNSQITRLEELLSNQMGSSRELDQQISDLTRELNNLQEINRVSNERLNAILNSFNTQAFGEVTGGGTVNVGAPDLQFDTLPRRIEQLQTVIIENQQSQQALTAEIQKLENLQQSFATQSSIIRQASQEATRESLRSGLNQMLEIFAGTPNQNQTIFPDFDILMRTLVENLIEIEVSRVRAEAEDRILAAVLASSTRIADEQLRLLAQSSTRDQDTVQLLDNLIREIDDVANTAVQGRDNRNTARAVGPVISVARPNLTVRRASLFELARVRRVYISRILPNGDRIPIADAEIIATTGDDLILRVIDTIAPTIYPERNDLVFVEL